MNGLGLDRMPSMSECVAYFGNGSLASVISRKYGWYNLAKRMGMPIKKSETGFAKRYETRAAELLQALGFNVQRMSQNFPYDILVNNCIKIDVKASRLCRGVNGDYYSFHIDKPFATCDFYILLAVGDREEIERVMIIPSCEVITKRQISVGARRSKYYKYTDRYDLIEIASLFWTNIEQAVVL